MTGSVVWRIRVRKFALATQSVLLYGPYDLDVQQCEGSGAATDLNILRGTGLSVALFILVLASSLCMAQSDIIPGLSQEVSEEQAASKEISLTNTKSDDDDIRKRLSSILAEIDTLSTVSLQVSNSVVQLKGQVDSLEAKNEAQQFAMSLEGVVKVDNQIEVSRDVSDRVRTTWDRLVQLTAEFKSLLPLLVLAGAVVFAFWYLARMVASQNRVWSALAPNDFIASILGTVVRLLLVLAGILLALYLLDATSIITTVLGAAGIVGLALGFAVRDTVENFIASILLSLRQPFQMNDFVQIDDHSGSVARLTGRATILISADGDQIRIPNALVFKSIIINYTRHPQRRFQLSVPVDESENLMKAQQVAMAAVTAVNGVMDSPSPQVLIQSLGEAVVELSVFGWVNQQTHDLLKVKSASAIAIKAALKKALIVMPESVHTLRLIDDGLSRDIEQSRQTRAKTRHQAEQDGSRDSADSLAQQHDEAISLTNHLDASDDNAVLVQLAEEQSDSQNLLTQGNRE